MLIKFLVFGVVALIFYVSNLQPVSWLIIGFMVIKFIDIAHRRAGGNQTVTIKQNKTETGN